MIVTVFGGTGFLGRRIVAALLARGASVRVVSRHPQKTDHPRHRPVAADVTDGDAVRTAISGADAVVNAVSLYVERGDATFLAIHVEGARRVAEAAARERARLVHISGIGSEPASPSPYIRARGLGEDAVRDAHPRAAVLRPAVMMGAGDALLTTLVSLTRSPIFPLFGGGHTRLQPAHVGDVAEAAAAALAGPDPHPGVSELGGPEILTYRELVRRVARHVGHRARLVPLPFAAWRVLVAVASVLPAPPVTEGQVALMRNDNVADPARRGFADFALQPRDLDSTLDHDFQPADPGSVPSGGGL